MVASPTACWGPHCGKATKPEGSCIEVLSVGPMQRRPKSCRAKGAECQEDSMVHKSCQIKSNQIRVPNVEGHEMAAWPWPVWGPQSGRKWNGPTSSAGVPLCGDKIRGGHPRYAPSRRRLHGPCGIGAGTRRKGTQLVPHRIPRRGKARNGEEPLL